MPGLTRLGMTSEQPRVRTSFCQNNGKGVFFDPKSYAHILEVKIVLVRLKSYGLAGMHNTHNKLVRSTHTLIGTDGDMQPCQPPLGQKCTPRVKKVYFIGPTCTLFSPVR